MGKVLTSQQSIWNVPIFIFLLEKFCPVSSKSLNPVSMATTARNRKCFVLWKSFMEGDQIRVESIISVTSHLSPSAWFLGRVLIKNEFETAVVNKPSVFEPLKFYCITPKSNFLQQILFWLSVACVKEFTSIISSVTNSHGSNYYQQNSNYIAAPPFLISQTGILNRMIVSCYCCVPILITTPPPPRTSAERVHGHGTGRHAPSVMAACCSHWSFLAVYSIFMPLFVSSHNKGTMPLPVSYVFRSPYEGVRLMKMSGMLGSCQDPSILFIWQGSFFENVNSKQTQYASEAVFEQQHQLKS